MKGIRSFCYLAVVMGFAASSALGTVRVFMAPNGTQGAQPVTGVTTMMMDPGTTANVNIWIHNNSVPDPFNGYQLLIPWNATLVSGSGSVHYHDIVGPPGSGNSVLLNTARADWVFAMTPLQGVNYQEILNARFGIVYNMAFGTGINTSALGIRYAGEFSVTAEPGTNGIFELPFRTGPAAPFSILYTPSGGTFPTNEYQRLRIIVGPQNEACCFGNGTCQDLTVINCGLGGGEPQGPGTTCASTTCPTPPILVHATGQPNETRPCSGYTDPRRESTNGTDFNEGLNTLTMVFNEPVFALGGGALSPTSFEVVETGMTLAIEGAQEVPPSGSAARGRCQVSLNAALTQLRIRITHSLATVTVGHIHRGLTGVNGPVVFPFPSAVSPIDATWNIGAAELGLLRLGQYYANLHSAAFPGGEIRGQIRPNTVMAVDATNNPRILLTLSRKLSLQEWTTVRAVVQNAAGLPIVNMGNLGPLLNEPDRTDLGFLPSDVNQNSGVNPLDLLRFKQIVNNLPPPIACGIPVDLVDTDRNGMVSPLDLLAFKRLVNGISPSTQAWANKSMFNTRP